MTTLADRAAKAESAADAAEDEHVAAVAKLDELTETGSADPLAWARATGQTQMTANRVQATRQEATRLRRCARLAADLPGDLDGQRWVFTWAAGGRVVPYHASQHARTFGTGVGDIRPTGDSLLLLDGDDLAAIADGTWEPPEPGEPWYTAIAAQYDRGRLARYQAKVADIEQHRAQWQAQGIAWAVPTPPLLIPPWHPDGRHSMGGVTR